MEFEVEFKKVYEEPNLYFEIDDIIYEQWERKKFPPKIFELAYDPQIQQWDQIKVHDIESASQ